MNPTGFSMFVVALVVVYLMPGADMILILQTGASSGRSRALATAAGLALARAAHVALAGLGLAALFRAEPWTFDVARWGGAAYLTWMGVGILRSGWSGPDGDTARSGTASPATARLGHGTAFRRGLATNILNPKALLFCSMLLPQFVRPALGGVDRQFLTLGIVLVAIGLVFDTVYAVVGAGLGALLRRHPRLAVWQRRLFAGLLIGFGLRLATSGPA